MKAMTVFIAETSKRLVESFDADCAAGAETDLRGRFNKFSMDTIASCAFGIDAQSFATDGGGDSQFVNHAREIFRRNLTDFVKFIAAMLPGVRQVMGMAGISAFKSEQTLFFYDVVRKAVEHRLKTKERRNDLIDLMIDAMKDPESLLEGEQEPMEQFEKDAELSHKKHKEFDMISLVSTAIIMLIAGYDTTGTTLGYVGYVLATHPDIQKRLQEEVDDAVEANGGKLPDYKATMEMEYLDMVLHETLRLHSPIGLLQRVCNEDWDVPGHPGLKVRCPVSTAERVPVVILTRVVPDYEEPRGPHQRGRSPQRSQALPGSGEVHPGEV